MICKKCGAMIPDDSTFCTACGSRIEKEPARSAFFYAGDLDGGEKKPVPEVKAQPVSAEGTGLRFSSNLRRSSLDRGETAPEEKTAPVVPERVPAAVARKEPLPKEPPAPAKRGEAPAAAAPAWEAKPATKVKACAFCGSALEEDALFCTGCGKRVEKNEAEKPAPMPKPGFEEIKSKAARAFVKLPKWVLPAAGAAIVVIVVIAVLIAGVLTNWFTPVGPADQIAAAINNTANARYFTVDFEIASRSGSYESTMGGTVSASVDPGGDELTYYGDAVSNGMDATVAFYKDYFISDSYYGVIGYEYGDGMDPIGLDILKESNQTESFWKSVLYRPLPLSVYQNKALGKCIAECVKKMDDPKWLEENTNYSVKTQDDVVTHSMDINMHSFLEEGLKDIKESISNQSYNELVDLVDSVENIYIRLEVEVKNGKLVRYEETILSDHINSYRYSLEFYDFGKNMIDTDKLEDLLAEAKENSY